MASRKFTVHLYDKGYQSRPSIFRVNALTAKDAAVQVGIEPYIVRPDRASFSSDDVMVKVWKGESPQGVFWVYEDDWKRRHESAGLQNPVLKPKKGEAQNDFMSRSIRFLMREGYPQKQAIAISYNQWRSKKNPPDKGPQTMQSMLDKAKGVKYHGRYVKVSIVKGSKKIGDTMIPEAWLMGATHSNEMRGMKPQEALQEAIKNWIEHEQAKEKFVSNPRGATKIYQHIISIKASKAGMPHNCDAACRRAGHRYEHKFNLKNSCIYGSDDGSFFVVNEG